jgi:hypothetical protein
MKRKFKGILIVSALLAMMLTSCEYEFINPTPPVPPPPPGDTISFSQDIQPFLDNKCVKCHKPGQFAPVLSSGLSHNALISGGYVVAGDPASSDLYKACSPGGSMASYADATERELLSRWIYAGAKND